MRFTVLVSFLAALAVLSVTAGPAQASVITTGDVDPGGAAAQPDPWAVGGNLYVGKTGTGTLTAEAGGVVSSLNGRIGDQSNSTGMATVSGSGSQWNNVGSLSVGTSGEGAGREGDLPVFGGGVGVQGGCANIVNN